MSDKNPVSYAERTLGVHEVYDEAIAAHTALSKALTDYADQAAAIRGMHDAAEQREYTLALELREQFPDMSNAALDRAIKDMRRSDEDLKAIRANLFEAQSLQEQAHAEIEKNKYRLRVLSARLNELGGLLAFYAAAKVERRTQPSSAGEKPGQPEHTDDTTE